MIKFNLIVAVCENWGIGFKGDLPWHIKSELKYFSRTTKRVKEIGRRNAVIMGRKTYFGVPKDKRPLPERLNIVLSTTLTPSDLPEDVVLQPSLQSALKYLEFNYSGKEKIESVWIVGGSGVYAEAMTLPNCHRLYLTKIYGQFECDTFFPQIPNDFIEIKDQQILVEEQIPQGLQNEKDIVFEYKMFQKVQGN